jgi:drug/metabolite transporter (DMT)-like permease
MKSEKTFSAVDLALVLTVLMWAANISIVKSALAELSPLAFDALRMGGATLLTLFGTWVIERDLSLPRETWWYVILLGFIGHFCYQVFFITGLARTTASASGLLLGTSPLFVALIGTLTRSEKLALWNWAGIVLSFFGACLLAIGGGPRLALSIQTLQGDLFTLGAASMWAAYTVGSKRLVRRISPLKATAWTMIAGLPFLLVAALPSLRNQNWQAVSRPAWLGLAYSSVFAIALAYVLWTTGVQRIGSARTSVYHYLVPVGSVVLARVLLGESMLPLQIMGAAGILIGIALVRYRRGG